MARSRVSLRNAHTLTHFYPAVQRKTQHHALTPIVFNISLQCICNRKQDINFINTCTSSLWGSEVASQWLERGTFADCWFNLGKNCNFFFMKQNYNLFGTRERWSSTKSPYANSFIRNIPLPICGDLSEPLHHAPFCLDVLHALASHSHRSKQDHEPAQVRHH